MPTDQPSPETCPIHATLYHGAKRPKPTRQDDFEGGWPQFVESLQDLIGTLPDCPDAAPPDIQKENMVAWSPHRLSKPYRHLDNVRELTLMVIDVDRCNLVDLCDNLEAMGWAALIYGSPSDSEELPADARRVRVISPISRPILPSECEATRFAYAECLGLKPGQGVEGAKDAAKLFFIGLLHGSDERLWAEAEGMAVDVDDLLSLDLANDWRSTAKPNQIAGEVSSDIPADKVVDPAILFAARELLRKGTQSVEGYGGERALFDLSRLGEKLLTDPFENQYLNADNLNIGEDPAVQAQVLEAANPILCSPKWDQPKIAREAQRRAENAASPEERMDRRTKLARREAEIAQPSYVEGEADELGRIVDWGKPIEPLKYLCEGLGIGWVGKCAGVHGYAGTSKGLFVARLLLSAASGQPFLGHAVRRVPVVYCDAETGAIAENRIKRLALAMGIDLGELSRDGWWSFRHVSASLTELIDSGALERACTAADKGEGVVLGIDSYSSMVGGDENDSEYADPLWALGRLGQACNAIPIVVMHDRKGTGVKGVGNPLEGVSGTNRLAAALASSIRLTPSEDNDRVITVGCTRAPEKRFDPIELTWADVEGGGIAAECESAQLPTAKNKREGRAQADADRRMQTIGKRADAVESLLKGVIADNMTAKKIRSTIAMNGDDWIDVRRELLRRERVIENKTGKFPTYRLLPSASAEVRGKMPRRGVPNLQRICTAPGHITGPGQPVPENRKVPVPVGTDGDQAETKPEESLLK